MAKSNIQEITYNQPALSSGRGSNGAANGAAGASVLQTIGAVLRERRETTNLSLADVEKATRIRQKYLAALEADEWHLLPGEVVGRGFLRNYASYLNLNATDLMERRRDMTDGDLARVLSKTSAGALLPPTREVDYRPKDFDLEETPISSRLSEYVATGRDWFAPIISLIAIALVVFLIFWGVREVGQEAAMLYEGVRTQIAELMAQERPSIDDLLAGDEGETDNDLAGAGDGVPPANNGDGDSNGDNGNLGASDMDPASGSADGDSAVAALPAATDTPTPTATAEPPTPTPTATAEPPTPTPTVTPEPVEPTPTPEPVEPTPTPEPVEPTPTPEPAVVAPSCPDNRSAITSPGANQTVSGAVQVLGNATHEQFNFYKLEVAPGANAEGGFGYFGGTSAQVQGGVLGNFDSAAYANGPYTIQLTVVDATGNYPPPCRVTINVQN